MEGVQGAGRIPNVGAGKTAHRKLSLARVVGEFELEPELFAAAYSRCLCVMFGNMSVAECVIYVGGPYRRVSTSFRCGKDGPGAAVNHLPNTRSVHGSRLQVKA